jgi:hypothetical protein
MSSLIENVQKESMTNDKYYGIINNIAVVSLEMKTIQKDTYWNNIFQKITMKNVASKFINRILVLLDPKTNDVFSIYEIECYYNLACFIHQYGKHNDVYVQTAFDYFLQLIPKIMNITTLNEIGVKYFYYVNKSEDWKLPHTKFVKSTNHTILGTQIMYSNEYKRKFKFNSEGKPVQIEKITNQNLDELKNMIISLTDKVTHLQNQICSSNVQNPSTTQSSIPQATTNCAVGSGAVSSPTLTSSSDFAQQNHTPPQSQTPVNHGQAVAQTHPQTQSQTSSFMPSSSFGSFMNGNQFGSGFYQNQNKFTSNPVVQPNPFSSSWTSNSFSSSSLPSSTFTPSVQPSSVQSTVTTSSTNSSVGPSSAFHSSFSSPWSNNSGFSSSTNSGFSTNKVEPVFGNKFSNFSSYQK